MRNIKYVIKYEGQYLRATGGDWGPEHLTTKRLRDATTFPSISCAEDVNYGDGKHEILPVSVSTSITLENSRADS